MVTIAATRATRPSTPSPLMVWYAVGYVVVMFLVAVRLFSARDL